MTGAADHSTSITPPIDTAARNSTLGAAVALPRRGRCCAGLASAIEKPGDFHEALTWCLVKAFH
jgi:hypothetical protein